MENETFEPVLLTEELEKRILAFNPYDKKEVQLSESIRLHYEQDKELTREVLGRIYPSEPENLRQYRLDNIHFITKAYFDKVYSIISNLRNEPEFEITSNGVIQQLLLSYYGIESVSDYVFDNLLILLFVDPNALFINDSGRFVIIRSKDLIYFDENQYVVYRYEYNSNTYYVVLSRFRREIFTVEKGKLVMVAWGEPYCDLYNAFYIGGPPADIDKTYYNSIIGGAVSSWTSALIAASDLTCMLKQHAYPEKYRYITESCGACNGTGTQSIATTEGRIHSLQCKRCAGTGRPATGVFSEVQIDVTQLVRDQGIDGTTKFNIPTPPIGYIEKDLGSIEFIDKKSKDFIKDGLSALSMEFLMDVPEQQSGVAKLVDRAELIIYLKSVLSYIGRLIVNIGKSAYYFNYDQLRLITYDYVDTYKSDKLTVHIPNQLISFLPPNKETDVIFSSNQSIRYGQEEKELERHFSGNELIKQKLMLFIDPLKGLDLAQKLLLKNSGVVSDFDIFLSIRLPDLVEAHIRDDGWALRRKDFNKSKEMIVQIAQQIFNQQKK